MRLTLALVLLCAGCPSTHQLLSSTDATPDAQDAGAADSAIADAGTTDSATPDASECGPAPTDGAPCLKVLETREGQSCCQGAPTPPECREGAWQCPDGFVRAAACDFTAPACPWSDCDPMDAHSSILGGDCTEPSVTRYAWDGRACRPVGFGCGFTECVGEDCGSLYSSIEECLAARASCGAGACETMDARFPPRSSTIDCGGSESATWWVWNGWACEMHEDCAPPTHCRGVDCGAAYSSRTACEAAHGACLAACDPTDAEVTCEARGTTPHYAWNGHACALIASCDGAGTCAGTDCDQVFNSLDECRQRFRHCVGPASVEDEGALTCHLIEEEVVSAAVRLDACGFYDTPSLIGSWFQLRYAIADASFGFDSVPSCEVLRCASEARTCAEVEACVTARDGECPDARLDVCLGTEICRAEVHEGARVLRPWADCATLGGTCVMRRSTGNPDEIAVCEVPGNPSPGPGRSGEWCDQGDMILRTGGGAVRLSCSQYLPGTQCGEVLLAGEIPSVACRYPTPECDELASFGVECDGDVALLCVGGRPRRFDCLAAGYSGCMRPHGCVP